MGSPPRMRGKAMAGNAPVRAYRITPAYAGKRHLPAIFAPVQRDHPRVCGEKSGLFRSNAAGTGSPPRMRGKAKTQSRPALDNRITPAYAGKSWINCHFLRGSWDHPRVCGEKKATPSRLTFCRGSPPRMRGKAPPHAVKRRLSGITPAYAGKRLKRSHSIGHFSCILCLFHSVLHRASASGGSRSGPCAPPCLPAQNAVPV